jgi:endonuclease/exonuclease/phosphatase family metal-dependent hydrolase
MVNDLIITNTKFPHKWIHKITREAPERGEKSVIDYITVSKEMYKDILDSRVKRGPEIGSDHYLLQMELEVKIPKTE